MAVFQSKYRELSFDVGDKTYRFREFTFETDDSKVIAVLEKLRNVWRVDTPKDEPKPSAMPAEQAESVKETVVQTEEKAPSKRKSSAK